MSDDAYAVRTFEEFWPHYARMHSRRETQVLHAVATLGCGALIAVGIVTARPWLVVLAPLVDYAIAQSSHRLFEKNRTSPWKNHLWHARAELRMLERVLTGTMPRQGQPVGVQARSTAP
jgi:hypothetical protein